MTADEGQPATCGACLFIADDRGDNSATICCQQIPAHEGLHKAQLERGGGLVTITWAVDERRKCNHGCGQWTHDHHNEVFGGEHPKGLRCPRYADDHEYSDCTHCHPGKPPLTCSTCSKTHYYAIGHQRSCPSNNAARTSDGTLLQPRN